MSNPTLSQAWVSDPSREHPTEVALPDTSMFELPEKVLQFGTGVLLRGLPDFFIDQANRKGMFNGRVVVVKSTEAGSTDAFEQQDGLYTLCQRGIEGTNGPLTESLVVSAAISRVLSARDQWAAILACAHNPALQIIISNTTEVGIQLTPDRLDAAPPASFPGKLTAFLLERYRAFGGSADSGMVIVPCELLVDNGIKLKEIVLALATQHRLEEGFIEWLHQHNAFCNSLVDRIVTGMPDAQTARELYQRLGFQDDLLTVTEQYRLWAIEGNVRVRKVLSFEQADIGVVILPDIQPYRERKLRLLNGTHTLTVGLGFLCGLNTVGECMEDPAVRLFIEQLMLTEIAPTVLVEPTSAQQFAREVLNRFANPAIVHPLINITVQCSSKMRMRNVQTLLNHYASVGEAPPYFSLGFAAYLRFMRVMKEENGKFFGERAGVWYPIQDDLAAYFYEQWQTAGDDSARLVTAVAANQTLWGTDLTALPGFAATVNEYLRIILKEDARAALKALLHSNPEVQPYDNGVKG